MSKFIPKKETPDYGGQVKPKLKIKVNINGEQKILTEYELAQMISDINMRQSQMEQALKGIMDAMEAATKEVGQPKDVNKGTPVNYSTLKLPKLNTVQAGIDDGKKFYNNSDGGVKIES
tara:strand:+ start:108 stop:464 length:357 start_codon:yes stop_codon:yes gene_type:complete